MWTPQKPSDGSKDGYALGWGTGSEDGVVTVGHDGGQQGTSTAFVIAPTELAGVVVLTNMDGLDPHKLAIQILRTLLGEPPRKP
jgi:CubicO group peptidase (beta-lactamase class C family)